MALKAKLDGYPPRKWTRDLEDRLHETFLAKFREGGCVAISVVEWGSGKMRKNGTQLETRKFAGKFDGELWDLLGWYLKHEIHVSGRTLTRILVLAFWSKPKTCCLCMSSNACSIQSDFPIAIWCYHVPCGHVVCPRLAACSYRAQGWWGLRWVCEELPGCRWWRIKKESQLFSPGTHPPKRIKVLLEGLRVSWGPFLLGDGGLCL